MSKESDYMSVCKRTKRYAKWRCQCGWVNLGEESCSYCSRPKASKADHQEDDPAQHSSSNSVRKSLGTVFIVAGVLMLLAGQAGLFVRMPAKDAFNTGLGQRIWHHIADGNWDLLVTHLLTWVVAFVFFAIAAAFYRD